MHTACRQVCYNNIIIHVLWKTVFYPGAITIIMNAQECRTLTATWMHIAWLTEYNILSEPCYIHACSGEGSALLCIHFVSNQIV